MPARPITDLCVPDIHLPEERLHMLFDGMNTRATKHTLFLTTWHTDFSALVLRRSSPDLIFADLVNGVQIPYLGLSPHH